MAIYFGAQNNKIYGKREVFYVSNQEKVLPSEGVRKERKKEIRDTMFSAKIKKPSLLYRNRGLDAG